MFICFYFRYNRLIFIVVSNKQRDIYSTNTATEADLNTLSTAYREMPEILNSGRKQSVIIGDFNIDLLSFKTENAYGYCIRQTLCASYVHAFQNSIYLCHSK